MFCHTPVSYFPFLSLRPEPLLFQEYKRKQIEEQRQAERLQRQLQQERAYLVSLQQQQQEGRQAEKKQLYHYKDVVNPNDKPAWAKEVSPAMHGWMSEDIRAHLFISKFLLVVKSVRKYQRVSRNVLKVDVS